MQRQGLRTEWEIAIQSLIRRKKNKRKYDNKSKLE